MLRVVRGCPLVLVCLLQLPHLSQGQSDVSTPNSLTDPAADAYAEAPLARPVLLSAGLGSAGFLVGSLGGGLASVGCSGDQCELEGVLLGATLGLSAGSALGAHLGNRRRRSFALDVLAGVGAAAVGLGLSEILFEDTGNAFLILISIGQIASAVGVERAFARRIARKADVDFSGTGRQAGRGLRVIL